MQRYILHIDMNSYFASVEQQANPLLRGKPVGVCAYLSKNGCIIASSIEAKKLGIKTGTLVWQAQEICPDIVLVENEPAKYRSTTKAVFDILADYTDRLEPYSIDEAFLDLTGYAKSYKEAEKIAHEIKKRIQAEVGEWLRCSIGISFTKFLAKFAADVADNDSLMFIKKSDLEKVFVNRELQDAWGINKRMEARLNGLGIFTLEELRKYPVANLLQVFGKNGYYLWAHVNGIEIEEIKRGREMKEKSVGHSYCLPKKTRNLNFLTSVLMKLCEKTGRRLREKNQEATVLSLSWRYETLGGFHTSRKVSERLCTSFSIFQAAFNILKSVQLIDNVSMLAVSVNGLEPPSKQMSLFGNKKGNFSISKAMDKINDKYGEYIIYYGSMFNTKDYASDRIGFRKTVGVKC